MEVKVEGADQLHKVYKEINTLGSKDLRKKLTKAIRDATVPTKDSIKQTELAKLPKRGGLAARQARNRISNRVRMSQRDPGVSINIISEYDLAQINRGRLRHRVFGTNTWVNQKIPPGVVTEPIDETKPRVQEAIKDELRKIADRLHN